MQYLVRKIHHTTGEVFMDATKAKDNETFIVVDAESAEEAKEKVKKPKGLLSYVKRPGGTLEEQLQRVQDKALKDASKDSE
ncbi:DUF1381 domain-containing protein [Staphylococcus nepalensis]|uniref:DUF1381 domain-containing protein n=1 Tax=Staphylococcus nepalensis TaxID=214473 RepID=UPI00226EF788|nr:DUF1381 domain-containing protein [Staphylococcus nepalensis]MCY1039636.1 DUF1381 domain-containing protein [Staphylococcus nepalensis]